jgi:hypothetical protein
MSEKALVNKVLLTGEEMGLFADPAHQQWILVFPLHGIWVLN